MTDLGLGLAVLVVLGSLLAWGGWNLWTRVQDTRASDAGPPVLFPAWKSETPAPARPTEDRERGAGNHLPTEASDIRREAGEGMNRPDGWQPAPSVPAAAGHAREAEADRFTHGSEAVDAGEVHFHRPLDGTLQLLPGRLRIVAGEGVGEEIRFVRIPTVKPAVTFGRNPGPPHQHVQLRSPTVSRMHARFDFVGGRWSVRNLSETNPTTVNGTPLLGDVEQATLEDGDRIEMGEIAFVFHQKEGKDRLPLRSSWYTDRGRRASNQDAVLVRTLPDGRELAVVCDGMGSHAAGGVASHMALEGVTGALGAGVALQDAVANANGLLREEGLRDPDREGMATTMVAMLREGDSYSIVNVGDSRAYRVEAGRIEQITRDHSFAAEAVRTGEMSVEEASKSPWKNAVTRMLGSEDEVDVDLFGPYSTTDPHLVLLCSDGIHGVFPDEDLLDRILSVPDIGMLAKDLGEEALRRGSKDNVGVAAIAFAGGPARVKTEVG